MGKYGILSVLRDLVLETIELVFSRLNGLEQGEGPLLEATHARPER